MKILKNIQNVNLKLNNVIVFYNLCHMHMKLHEYFLALNNPEYIPKSEFLEYTLLSEYEFNISPQIHIYSKRNNSKTQK